MPKFNIINWVERRIKRRHKAPDLRVTVRPSGFRKWFRTSVKVSCLDFNRYGMAIESNKYFKPKDKILIGFKGKYISQSNVLGLITECVDSDEAYRISIAFCYAIDSKNYNRKIDNALSRIESLYGHNQKPKIG